MGPGTFVYGFFIHYIIQIICSLVILYLKSEPGFYAFPGFIKLFTNSKNEFIFIFNYSFCFLFELVSYESIPFILLYSSRPSLNIGIWSIIIQVINIIFYLSYAASAYSRSVCNPFLARKNFRSFRDHIKWTSFYLFITISLLNLLAFVSSNFISALFFIEDESRILLGQCIKLLSMFFLFEGFIVYLNSTLRMIGFEAFCFYTTFVNFVCLFPVTMTFLTLTYDAGVFVAILVLFTFTGIINLIYLFKLCIGFEKNVKAMFKFIEEENLKMVLSDDKSSS